jgi:hypothetical protein
MTVSHWANIAQCASERMDLLWEQACDASRGWEDFHNRRWREHSTYMLAQHQAHYIWSLP